jgi:hypothetical protein
LQSWRVLLQILLMKQKGRSNVENSKCGKMK